MVPNMVTTCYNANTGKLRVYHGRLNIVAPGLNAMYVTRYTYVCSVRHKATYSLSSLPKLSCGVRLVHHTTLRDLRFQARYLIAVTNTAYLTNSKTYKFPSFSLSQPSVVVDSQLLSGLHSRSTQAPDLVSCRPRHFTSLRGYILILNINSVLAAYSPGRSTPDGTHVNIVVPSTQVCAIIVNIVTDTPNGVKSTNNYYGYAHARHDAIG